MRVICPKPLAAVMAGTFLLMPVMAVYAESAAPEVIEITMPNGKKQKGFIQNGSFVMLADPQAEVAPQNSETLTGKTSVVVETPVAVLDETEAAKLMLVETQLLPLDSKLKKRYAAYKITVTSNYPNPVSVVSGDVPNAIDGPMAYQLVKGSTSKSLFGALLGVAGVVLITAPSAGVIHHRNKKAENEAVLYPGQVPMVEHLNKGESFEFMALVPLGQKPQVRIAFRDDNKFEFVKNSQ